MRPRVGILDERELGQILLSHADALVLGEDNTDMVLSKYPAMSGWLEGLLMMARDIRDVLVAVEPSERFVLDLRARLADVGQPRRRVGATWQQRRQRATQVATVLGTVVSILAVLALATRLIGALVIVILFLANRRKRIVSAPKGL